MALVSGSRVGRPAGRGIAARIRRGARPGLGNEPAGRQPIRRDGSIPRLRASTSWSALVIRVPPTGVTAPSQRGAPSARAFEAGADGVIASAQEAATIRALKKQNSEARPKVATRKASEMALEAINPVVTSTIGGSADLTGSNNTKTKALEAFTAESYGGRYIYYGIREFGMAAAMNGMALHGGVIPYGGTFLIFSDYCRPAIRLAALQQVRSIFVMTHDSIGLGEDGPTHQPVEQLVGLRAIPNLDVYRPADAVETAECWELALRKTGGPSLLALSRQNLPQVRLAEADENRCARGAYRLRGAGLHRRVVLMATGSEVHVALQVAQALEQEEIGADVVSVPCWSLFDAQDEEYRNDLLPAGVLLVSIEAGATLGWERYTGRRGLNIGLDRFGASAPAEDLFQRFGFTAEAIVPRILAALKS